VTATLEQVTATAGRRGRLRRRFTVVSAGMLSILMAILGVSFAADAGTTTTTVEADGAGVVVYSVGQTVDADVVATLKYGSKTVAAATVWNPATTPTWAVAAGSAGSVTAGGDLAYIDAGNASSASMMVSLYITNLDKLSGYSSYNFSVTLYKSTNAEAVTPTWTAVQQQTLTSDSGALNWHVPLEANTDYTLGLDPGGSFYTVSTAGGPASLSPQFFIRASQL
jgi:hypothetical protein